MAFRLGHRLSMVAAVASAGLLLSGGIAQAQIGNSPVMPGGVGLSQAGRQAILNSRLQDSRPRNLVRGADGSLLDIGRNGRQAFVRSQSGGTFTTASRGGYGWASGLGTGLGWGFIGGGGGVSYVGGRSGAPTESMRQWISMVQPSLGGSYADAGLTSGRGRTPIDDWIGQTD